MTQEFIQLNGAIYGSDNLHELQSWVDAPWKQEIYDFLTSWFDDSDEIITRTSGSTGTPKEIHLRKETMRNSARMTNAFFGLNTSKTALLCLPASYIAGKMMLVRALVGGFNLLTVEPKANPFQNITASVDFAAITPYQLHHSAETLQTVLVKNIIVGGGPVNSVLEKLVARLSTRFYETYGMTETASHIALRSFNGAEKSVCFTALQGVTLRQDERGCLAVLAPHLHSEELITNDMVELIGENQFRWLGRADSVINSGGVKIFPEQVEKKLEGLIPHRYFIASLPDELLGEKVVLFVESDTDIQLLESLKQLFSSAVEKYEVPKQIFCIPHFESSVSNKILRKNIVEHFKEKSNHPGLTEGSSD